MKTPHLYILALAALTGFAIAAEKDQHADHKKSPMAAMIADKSGADFEAAYLGMMIHHHKSGGPMWALAREKTTSDEIKALEKKTTPKEQREIEEMTAWLKQWHNKSPEDLKVPEQSTQMMEKDMAELRSASGKEFDKLFGKKMAHHHKGAIDMAKLAQDKAEHAEVKSAASKIVESQTADRKKLLSISEEGN
jgi:uncharacterized protein (DUF305 family)